MLSLMFKREHESAVQLSPGTYFLDDDPKLFEYILEYLHSGNVSHATKQTRLRLIERCEYYGLKTMAKKLRVLEGLPQKSQSP